MRVSDSHLNNIMLTGMSKSNTELSTLLQQMYSGEKITKVSDDPVASVKLLGLEKTQVELDQYINNSEAIKSEFQRYEGHTETIENGLQSANELLLWGLNGTLSDADRSGIVIELEALRETMQATFNAKNGEGSYIFSGTAIDQPPLTETDGEIKRNPAINSDIRQTAIGDGISMTNNISLEKLDAEAIFAMLDDSIEALKSPFDLTVLQGAHDSLLTSLNNVSSTQAYIGSQINHIDRIVDTHSDTELFAQKLEGDLKNLNYDEASLKFDSFVTALEATQKTYAQISSLSLFNQL